MGIDGKLSMFDGILFLLLMGYILCFFNSNSLEEDIDEDLKKKNSTG